VGVIPTIQAMEMAKEANLDLVEVASTERPPVCKIMDFGKFKFLQKQKAKDKTKTHQQKLKEISLRPKTDEHDIDFKSKQIERFIEEGDRVKVTLRFRGRELAHPGLGRQLLEEVADRVKNVAAVERMPLMEGNTMTMILTKAKAAPAPRTAQPEAPGEQPASSEPAGPAASPPRPA